MGSKRYIFFSSIVVLQRLKSTKLFTSSRDVEYFMWVVKPLIFQMVFLGTLYSNLASRFDISNTIPSPHHNLVHCLGKGGPYDYNLNIL